MERRDGDLGKIEEELSRFPAALAEEFCRARQALGPTLSPEALADWAQCGLSIARQTVRSWEAAAEYYHVSPEVLSLVPISNLTAWVRGGEALCQASPSVAVAYFHASPGSARRLQPVEMAGWAEIGLRLCKGTWKSSALAARFFEASPSILRHLSFQELQQFAGFIDSVAHRSYDLAVDCLALGCEVFPRIGEDRGRFLSLIGAMAEGGWRDVKGCFESAARALPRIEQAQRGRFLALAERLARGGKCAVSEFMADGSQALSEVDSHSHGAVLALGETLMELAPEAVPAFLKASPDALGRITVEQLELWFAEGVRLLRENREGGLAYFRLGSAHCEAVLEALSSSVELARVEDIMGMYCRALAGAGVKIASSQELAEKNIGWVSKERPSAVGSTVYLPPVVSRYSDKVANFAWYKVLSTHQVAHLEFGSFAFAYDRPSSLFRDLRPLLTPQAEGAAPRADGDGAEASNVEMGSLTDMQRFFDLFADRKLSLDVFTVVEDGRLDARVKREYAGIRSAYTRVQGEALSERPPMEKLPAREALVEFMVRLSLSHAGKLPVPAAYVEQARKVARIARRAMRAEAAVEDSAEATIRIYAIISQVPNQEVPPEEWESLDVSDSEDYQDNEDVLELQRQLQAGQEQKRSEPEQQNEEPYDSPQDVEYRGDFKPELAQLLELLKQSQKSQDSAPLITKEMLEQMLAESAEVDVAEGDMATAEMFALNLLKEAGMANSPQTQALGQGPLVHMDDDGGPLEVSDPDSYLYDEWDFRANDYRPRWCVVREKSLGEGDVSFWHQTLQAHAALLGQVRRQFEMVVPEKLRKLRRLKDGDDYELDAVLEAMIDKRTGVTPSDKIYWRRNKIERDVAVAFLLDMSASTAEAIDEYKRSDDWDAPNDPVEYMVWLRTRRGDGGKRSYKRIIDLEKESAVLLIQALETLGDKYAIYGFSGYGRENIEFYVIKGLDENFGEQVRRRVDKIAPLHATRMGPAIRHATGKLDRVDAKTKVLFLISDGRPQDRGYSREGVEKEYAVHDTHMALTEARRKNIIPFCLTVDKAGHDYLRAMCGDMGYEVLADIHALPQRLPYLYRRLTV